MNNNNKTQKRKRNFNNNNNSNPSKRARLNKKGVSFSEWVRVKNLNMSEENVESRKKVAYNNIKLNSPNIEHLIERAKRQRRGNTKKYRNELVKNLKNKGKLFKD